MGYAPVGSSNYMPQIMTPNTRGVASRGARLTVTDDGVLSADAPTTAEIYDKMNTNHFTNNTATSKIDINSELKPTTAGTADKANKLATAVNIAGVSFDGSGSISISYDNLTNKPGIPAAQVQTDWNATTGLGVLLNKPPIPAAQVQTDWNATTGLGNQDINVVP